jgi:hypothetical protein
VNRVFGRAPAVVVVLVALANVSPGVANAGSGTLVAPAKIGTFVQLAKAAKEQGALGQGDAKQKAAENTQSEALLSQAYGGKDALVESYATNDLNHLFTLLAVRGASPLPWVPFAEPAYLNLAVAPYEAKAIGDAWCLISNDDTTKGKTPAPDSAHALTCMRTARNLTVQIYEPGPNEHPESFVPLLDEAWKQLAQGSEGGRATHPVTLSHATLPAKLGGLVDPAQATAGLKKSDAAFERKLSEWGKKTYANASLAFGGAPAVSRRYSSPHAGDYSQIEIVAVEAASPKPFELAENAKRLGLVRPPTEVVTVGDARCVISNAPTVPPEKPAPDSVNVTRCERTSGAHTLIARSSGPIAHDPKTIAAFADLAWDALGWQ